MPNCTRCGGEIRENMEYCPMCGQKIKNTANPVVEPASEPAIEPAKKSAKASAFYASRLVTVAKVFLIVMTSIKLIIALICTVFFILSILLPVIWILFAIPAICGILSTVFGTILIVKLYRKMPRKNIVMWASFALIFTSFVAGILLLIAPQEDID